MRAVCCHALLFLPWSAVEITGLWMYLMAVHPQFQPICCIDTSSYSTAIWTYRYIFIWNEIYSYRPLHYMLLGPFNGLQNWHAQIIFRGIWHPWSVFLHLKCSNLLPKIDAWNPKNADFCDPIQFNLRYRNSDKLQTKCAQIKLKKKTRGPKIGIKIQGVKVSVQWHEWRVMSRLNQKSQTSMHIINCIRIHFSILQAHSLHHAQDDYMGDPWECYYISRGIARAF
jgi:hypothetical protein